MLDALSENPRQERGVARNDVLSAVLATIRLSGSLQFCFIPTGEWQTDGVPRMAAMSDSGTSSRRISSSSLIYSPNRARNSPRLGCGGSQFW